ncbi:acyclic terpene utilization AtuA family protein [Rhodohalobacter halophilus]|uniref:acyclic terpene utilization AtuA family protein n=1 Tax=Rhodohalobacter halophilus TaxID=1812810 RepID=UPI00083FA2DB|nr:acyclic terpene utilization AtuA family protein [Rhodohalobacter halophilus]
MKEYIRIASGQGFWGDLPDAPVEQVKRGEIDYLVMDYLAEVTMSIMQKQRMRNENFGYARDFVTVIERTLDEISNDGVKVISNAGGVNPNACKDAILKVAKEKGVSGLKVAVVDGDDILPDLDQIIGNGHELNNMETGEPIAKVKDELLSANIYFGCRPIVQALEEGADIVITGRVTDTGLTLAPMVYEFGWNFEDYDLMSTGTIAGHIIECGAQVSGGNFTDWEEVEDFVDIGFPIIEAHPDGTFYVTKHDNTGGLVSEKTVKEQLLYEIGDPSSYITPDCIADFTSIRLKQEGKNRVKVWGITGKPATPTYKISASYIDGYKLSSTLVYSWPDAVKKARAAGEILLKRAEKIGIKFRDTNVEYVGLNACNEDSDLLNDNLSEMNEVQLRISVHGDSRDDLNRFGMEIAPLILTGPSGVTGFAGGRPKASEVVAYWPALLDKEVAEPRVTVFEV